MKYNPEDYENVKSRKKKFYEDHPDGRIIVESRSVEPLNFAYFRACIYIDKSDIPKSTGYAIEIRDTKMSQGRNGEYASVNYTSWTENCEESAVGRALDNAGYSGNLKCSREEMEKAERMEGIKPPAKKPAETKEKFPKKDIPKKEDGDPFELTPEAPKSVDRQAVINEIGVVMGSALFTEIEKQNMRENIQNAKTVKDLKELLSAAETVLKGKIKKETKDEIY